MPLQLDAADPARTDAKTAAQVGYIRIDFLQLTRTPNGDSGELRVGLYVDAAAAAAGKDPVSTRERHLTPTQAKTLLDQAAGAIYTQLSNAGGPFPNAVVVA